MKASSLYAGKELELFSRAHNWKSYVAALVKQHVTGKVAEVGAGLGNFSTYLYNDQVTSWTYIEPDERFRKILAQKMHDKQLQPGQIEEASFQTTMVYNTIMYLDVLEHIDNDRAEVAKMIRHLEPGGKIIILAPAHQHLYSEFDREIGHYRRYSKKRLTDLFSNKKDVVFCRYLDSAGYLSSLANRLFLKQKYPGEKQLAFWNAVLLPVSRITDKIAFHSFGRSLLLVWQKQKV